jgi:hypothetical protein
MDGRVDRQIGRYMDGWMWMGGWMDECIDEE